MHADRTKRTDTSAEMRMSFSGPVKAAFADLAAAVHFSKDFDPDIKNVLHEWAGEKTLKVHDIISALPAIAEETFKHIHATGDERAAEAWHEIRSQIAEHGFTLSPTSVRAK
jgi:hypothetical protein